MTTRDPLAHARAAWMKRDAAATIEAARPWMASPDRSIRVSALVLCGEALHELGKLPMALNVLSTAVTIDPGHLAAWAACARVMTDAGQREQATQAWRRVALRSPRDPMPWVELAQLYSADRQFEAAARAMGEARLRASDRPDFVADEVVFLLAAGQSEQAASVLEPALRQFPTDAGLWMAAVDCAKQRGHAEQVLDRLNHLLSLEPTHCDARSVRASHLMQTRSLDAAADDVSVLLQLEPERPRSWMQAIRLAMLQKNQARARALVDRLLLVEEALSTHEHAHGLLYRAELRGLSGDVQGEWTDLVRGQNLLQQAHGVTELEIEQYRRAVQFQAARLRPGSEARKVLETVPMMVPVPAALSDRPPVFMFGFPRSGTTLLERVLGAHPRFTPTDEANLLASVLTSLRVELGNIPVEHLSDGQVAFLRRRFEQAARSAGFDPTNTRLIDKLPLNFIFVDIIRRVFPDATVVMLLRDPRACVWSAFRQPFQPNPAFARTYTFSGTAQLYAETMALWRDARSLEGLRLCEVHYEHLVTRFEETARRVVEATGAEWDPVVLHFHRSLGRAFVRTPSFAAVGQSVNTGRLSRWKRHADRFVSVMPLLQTFVDEWGLEAVIGSAREAGPEEGA